MKSQNLSTNCLKGHQSGEPGAQEPSLPLVHEDAEHRPGRDKKTNHDLLGNLWTGSETPSSWLTNAEGISYPPSPWRLGGTGYMSIWQVPIKDLSITFPSGVEPVTRFGRVTVVTGWMVYTPGSVLDYNELFFVVEVKANHRRLGSLINAWVDSPASVAGGRALWNIPKQLGTFKLTNSTTFKASAAVNGQAIASFQFRPRFTLPGWWRIPSPSVQWSESGTIQMIEGHLLGRVQFGTGNWTIAADGPLAFLSGRKPLLNLRVEQMAFSFGI